MSAELEDLYQEVILDHNRHPANFRPMADADRRVEADNPLCGDRLELFLKLEGERIADIEGAAPALVGTLAGAALEADGGTTDGP